MRSLNYGLEKFFVRPHPDVTTADYERNFLRYFELGIFSEFINLFLQV